MRPNGKAVGSAATPYTIPGGAPCKALSPYSNTSMGGEANTADINRKTGARERNVQEFMYCLKI